MRKFYGLFLLAFLILVACNKLAETNNKPYNFVINGTVEKLTPDLLVHLLHAEEGIGLVPFDSTIVKSDHSYQIKATVETPDQFYLQCENQMVLIWGESEDITVDFKGKDIRKSHIETIGHTSIKGGRNNELIDRMRRHNSIINQMESAWISSLQELNDNKSTEELIQEKVIPFVAKTRKIFNDQLLKEYADCNSIVVLLSSYDDEDFDKAVQFLSVTNPTNSFIQHYIKQREAARSRFDVGFNAPYFAYANKEGKQIDLNDYRSNLLVVNFWASWSDPCRNELKNLKRIYQEYHKKGVEFLSVSIDVDKDEWLRAVEEESMPWEQLMTNDVGKKVMYDYQFNIIPFIILLDEQGKIISINLRGDELSEVLNKQLNN
jgi:thiol-disulfide isomerase/thioredoxin